MALPSTLIWRVRAGGSNNNGGAFATGASGTDYSQQDAAQVAYTDIVIDGADNTKCTSAGTPFTSAHVGNVINILSGTGFTVQHVYIVSQAAGVATVDKSLGTLGSTGGTGNLGGAKATGATVGALTVAGNTVSFDGTTYTITSTWNLTTKGDITSGRITWDLNGSTITSSTNSVAILTMNDADYTEIKGGTISHSAATRGIGLTFVTSTSQPFFVTNCVFDGCLQVGTNTSAMGTATFVNVEIKNCTSATVALQAGNGVHLFGCSLHDNAGDAIRGAGGTTGAITVESCLIYLNSGNAVEPVDTNNTLTLQISNSVLCDNNANCISLASNTAITTLLIYNNIIYSNTGWGISDSETQIEVDAAKRLVHNNAFGDNSSGAYTGIDASSGEITLTADPFIDKSSGDFRLNNAAGGGALLRAAGWPNSWKNNTTVGYKDVGAAQHRDPPAARSLIASSIGTY